jgi:hypothetical protein
MGSRHRIAGCLRKSIRGLVLEVDDGGIYALDVDRPVVELLGQRVTAEGTRSGFDRLDDEIAIKPNVAAFRVSWAHPASS